MIQWRAAFLILAASGQEFVVQSPQEARSPDGGLALWHALPAAPLLVAPPLLLLVQPLRIFSGFVWVPELAGACQFRSGMQTACLPLHLEPEPQCLAQPGLFPT